jgi:hypothetical protein
MEENVAEIREPVRSHCYLTGKMRADKLVTSKENFHNNSTQIRLSGDENRNNGIAGTKRKTGSQPLTFHELKISPILPGIF